MSPSLWFWFFTGHNDNRILEESTRLVLKYFKTRFLCGGLKIVSSQKRTNYSIEICHLVTILNFSFSNILWSKHFLCNNKRQLKRSHFKLLILMLNVSFWKLWRLWRLWQSDNFMLAGYRLRTVRDRNPFGTLRESAPLKHHRDMTKTWIKNVEIFSDSNMNIQISMNLKFISWCGQKALIFLGKIFGFIWREKFSEFYNVLWI